MDKNSADSNSVSQQHYAQAAVQLGQRLHERRHSLGRPIDELVVALRSSSHQLQAIEAGKTEVFYGRSYYESLLFRYAEALGISKADALQMLRPPPAPNEAESQAPEDADSMAADSMPTEAQSNGLRGQPQAMLHEEPTEQPQGSSDRSSVGLNEPGGAIGRPKPFVWGFAAVAGIGLAVVAVLVVLSLPESSTPELARPAAQIATQPAPLSPPTPPIPSTPSASPAGETPAEQSQGTAAAPVVAVPTPPPAAAPAAKPSMPAAAPALVITAGDTSTWYWVRKANEDVEQRGLAPGQSVSFDQLPQYLVLNDPTRLRVVVQGRDMPVKPNDETGRNIARLGRSALQAAADQPASNP